MQIIPMFSTRDIENIGMDHTPDGESEIDDENPMIHLCASVISVAKRFYGKAAAAS